MNILSCKYFKKYLEKKQQQTKRQRKKLKMMEQKSLSFKLIQLELEDLYSLINSSEDMLFEITNKEFYDFCKRNITGNIVALEFDNSCEVFEGWEPNTYASTQEMDNYTPRSSSNIRTPRRDRKYFKQRYKKSKSAKEFYPAKEFYLKGSHKDTVRVRIKGTRGGSKKKRKTQKKRKKKTNKKRKPRKFSYIYNYK
jgi:hypothetical protein